MITKRKPNYTKTKRGKVRKGKVTITQKRLEQRKIFWEVLRAALRKHLETSRHGEMLRMGNAVASPSQIHRWLCEDCDHDQEPTFSQGMSLVFYLAVYKFKQQSIDCQFPKPKETAEDIATDAIIEEILRMAYTQKVCNITK